LIDQRTGDRGQMGESDPYEHQSPRRIEFQSPLHECQIIRYSIARQGNSPRNDLPAFPSQMRYSPWGVPIFTMFYAFPRPGVRLRREEIPGPVPINQSLMTPPRTKPRGTSSKFRKRPSGPRHPSRPGNQVADKTLPPAGGLWKHENLVSKTVGLDERKPKDLNP
jgi:hypothetical protein